MAMALNGSITEALAEILMKCENFVQLAVGDQISFEVGVKHLLLH